MMLLLTSSPQTCFYLTKQKATESFALDDTNGKQIAYDQQKYQKAAFLKHLHAKVGPGPCCQTTAESFPQYTEHS